MPHTGTQINVRQALKLCHNAGFRGERLSTAVAVMSRESARFTGAYYMNTRDDGTVWSVDRGLFQINSAHEAVTDELAFDPVTACQAAFKISERGTDFTPWMAYTGGAYLEALAYTEHVRTEFKDEWMAIDLAKRAPTWVAPIPQDVLDWRATQ